MRQLFQARRLCVKSIGKCSRSLVNHIEPKFLALRGHALPLLVITCTIRRGAPFTTAAAGVAIGSYASQMERINGQVQDLRGVFAKQHYVHPDFRGSTSIKAVMPVLAPELSYDDLEIKEGATASQQWWKMTADGTPRFLRDVCDLEEAASGCRSWINNCSSNFRAQQKRLRSKFKPGIRAGSLLG
jgi:hypothetical protein